MGRDFKITCEHETGLVGWVWDLGRVAHCKARHHIGHFQVVRLKFMKSY
jgi:hypothetical protein